MTSKTFIKAIAKGAVVISACLVLVACSTQTRYERDYSNAKKNFAEQNYRSAFNQVQAPANAGNPSAQYALGYMYYNGLGTIASNSQAAYWFQKSAAQGYKPAKKALREIKSGTPS